MSEWKDSEVGLIPEDWNVYNLSNFIRQERGVCYGVVQPGFHDPEGIPIIRVNNIKGGRIITDEVLHVSTDIESKYKRSRLEGNEILITLVGNVGEIAIVDSHYKNWNVARAVGVLPIDQKNIYIYWLKYWLQSIQVKQYINSHCNTTVQATLNLGDVSNLPILEPPLEEQKQIADVLSCLDAKIENLRRQNETLEQIAQTLFKHWFIDFEFPNADGKPYKSSGGAIIFSELGDIPEGWAVSTLESEVEIQKGVSYKGEGLADSITGIPMHNLKSVYEGGGYRHDGIKFYNGDYKERHICKTGDIIVPNTEQGEKHKLIGFPARIPRYFKDVSILTHHLFKVVPLKTSHFSRQYIYYLITSHITRKQILGYTNGTTVNMLSPDGFKKPLVVKPDKNIIKSFTQVVNPIWEKQESNFDQLQTLAKTRDSLLPKLMSGQLRVKE